MRLGLGSFAYAWSIGVGDVRPREPMTVFTLLEEAARLEVRLVQIGDNLPLHALSSHELAAVRAQAEALGVALQVGMRGIAPDLLRRYLDLAEYVGSPLVRTVLDTAEHHPSLEEVINAWQPLIPELEARGLTVAIENHDRFKARALAHLLQRLDSEHVGICLDTLNSLGALEGPEVVVPTLAPWTVNLHIKDFIITRINYNMGFIVEGRPAGQGMLDIPWLLGILKAHGRDPDAIIELWPPPEETLEATIAKEQRWAQESVAYLRAYIPD